MSEVLTFPPDFVWGAATSAYQIEGGHDQGGRGESIWDRFSHAPGNVQNDDTGDVACDHYHRFAEDVKLLAELGLKAYRFSVSWPRVQRDGQGSVNERGMDFYIRLVDALVSADVEPYITLYHWDLPQAFQDRGGWASRETAKRFADYAYLVSKGLGSRVHNWITLNEPWEIAYRGHLTGHHAPGIQDPRTALQAGHNLLVSHGDAVCALHANGDERTEVAISLGLTAVDSATDSDEDEEAALLADAFINRWFLDALTRGRYPEEIVDRMGDHMPHIEPDDMDQIGAPIEFLGINHYSRTVAAEDPDGYPLPFKQVSLPDVQRTEMGWEMHPDSIYRLLIRLHREYDVGRMVITENGAAFADELGLDQQVHDPRRIAYLRNYLVAVHRAIEEEVPVTGYFVWSLLDNFEWAEGYSKRFGIVYVDYPTQRRIVKDSGWWYGHVVRGNAVELEESADYEP